ncbi:MAG: extracellular solute-binding protein [Paracoccus sp. (in: a-proteobacteria)]|uniref:extracellular solute-binding protein n=1 Tax=Paracoccus sp. TaxID=267 RepID=UPI0026DF7C2B|nr:extracellular solute-binding protein [Paracoccus sp. (in: a-proteobacteria)]MDO5614512.1 extracellular solute-binding protein [Paracoccus sp. (in: a-proteobacteria)]
MRIFKFPDISAIHGGFLAAAVVWGTVAAMPLASLAEPAHGIAMYGEPALPAGFAHLPYANPDAPKGGAIRLAEPGGFDSLKPWVLKGNAAWGVGVHVAESLMYRSIDEPFTLYGLLAEAVDTDPDHMWVEFTLRPQARFSDGSPVTVEDVIWSYETLGTVGHPRYLATWAKIDRIEQTGERSLRLTFTEPDRELPLLMGMRPILKKAQWEGKDFAESGLEVPIGSGAYVVDRVDPGRSISFRRNPDYWGKDLPLNRGLHNLDVIRYDYFADANAMFEAFKAGEVTFWRELSAQKWATEYNFPLLTQGRVVQSEIPHQRPSGIMGLVMNTRNPIFADWRVRQAMIEAFNFRFIDGVLNGGRDPRISSYFANSPLAMTPDQAAQGREAELLAPFAADLPPGTIEGYALPQGTDRVLDRTGLRRALALLEQAGWTVQDGVLKDTQGQPFRFEILLNQAGTAMRTASETKQIVDIYVQALANLGITPRVTLLDSAQYIERTNNYQFDMTWYERALSLSPGNEQMLYWGHEGVTRPGSRNWMGMNSPAAEAMIATMLNAATSEDYSAAVRALDRVLTAGRYVIPVSYSAISRLAHSADLHYPERTPLYGDWPGFLPEVWWQAAQ